jgi:hypothetical protein
METIIPLRAAVQTSLTEAEQDCLVWSVLHGKTDPAYFATFCHPELADSTTLLKKLSGQFFSSIPAQEYMNAYRSLVEGKTVQEEQKVYSPEDMKRRKQTAVQKLLNYVIDQSNNIDHIEKQEDIIKFADKLGLLDTEEERMEQPRRYLPETCGSCRYKEFVEKNCVDD